MNFGGTGPEPTLGGSAEAVVLLVDAAVLEEVVERVTGSTEGEGELLVDAAVLEEVVERVTGSTEGEGELLVDAAVLEEVVERVGGDCACLACFLAAAFVCQPQSNKRSTLRVLQEVRKEGGVVDVLRLAALIPPFSTCT